MTVQVRPTRSVLRQARLAQSVTVAWMVVEGVVAVVAGIGAHSVALTAFGVDSGIEIFSSAVVLRRLLRRSLEERLPLTGTADHYVSQALYFDDPEGNGIEVYADRPRSEWQYPNGRLNIGTDHLDFERLLRIASPPQQKFSAGTLMGHVHLNVADLDSSQSFYESLGMELMAEAGRIMRFMSWDGYHHHLGINLLEGRGAAVVEPGVRGIQSFEARRIDGPRTDPNGILVRPD